MIDKQKIQEISIQANKEIDKLSIAMAKKLLVEIEKEITAQAYQGKTRCTYIFGYDSRIRREIILEYIIKELLEYGYEVNKLFQDSMLIISWDI